MNDIAQDLDKYGYSQVSWGTLRDEDLIPAFTDALDTLKPGSADMLRRDDAYSWVYARLDEGDDLDDLSDDEREIVSWLLWEDLFNLLNLHAPTGTFFGASEGDGSLYGFWPVASITQEEVEL